MNCIKCGQPFLEHSESHDKCFKCRFDDTVDDLQVKMTDDDWDVIMALGEKSEKEVDKDD